jgi:peptidoglycan lytic transglycosylase
MALTAVSAAVLLPAPAEGQTSNGGTSAPPAQAEPSPGATPFALAATGYVHRRLVIHGQSRRARHRMVHVERRKVQGKWSPLKLVRADRKGAWRASWSPKKAGSYELRAWVGTRSKAATGGTSAGGVAVGGGTSHYLNIYEQAIATWYGPGFFGRNTSCGQVLAPETMGVAHRTLPCGTMVQIHYAGRSIVVPVIDRGPFANNADWDLTQAAAEQLGMAGTSHIGAMPLAPSG